MFGEARLASGALRCVIFAWPALLLISACTTAPRAYTDPRPLPTAEERAAFGVIAVAPGGETRPEIPAAPDSRSNAEKAGLSVGAGGVGAGTGALLGLGCGPFAPFCVPIFAAAGGVTGLATGLAATLPYRTPEQVSRAEVTLRNSLLSTDLERELVKRVAVKAPQVRVLALPVSTPVSGAETEIRLTAVRFALVTLNHAERRNPSIRLEVEVEGSILQDKGAPPSFERRWLYDSEVHSYFEWADSQGALVLTEVERALDVLSEAIATDFLGRGSEPAVVAIDIPTSETESETQAPPDAEETAEEEGGFDVFKFLGKVF